MVELGEWLMTTGRHHLALGGCVSQLCRYHGRMIARLVVVGDVHAGQHPVVVGKRLVQQAGEQGVVFQVKAGHTNHLCVHVVVLWIGNALFLEKQNIYI